MDILVIEGTASRRVAMAQYLLRQMHRVTISSSIEEAREILQFITKRTEAPNAVVIGERFASHDSTGFREEIADRFPEAVWVPLPPHLSLDWLGDWLQGMATRMAARGMRSVSRGSSVLLVETNRAARDAAYVRFASEGATVRVCSSFKGAQKTMANWSARRVRPDFIVSPIAARDGDGITFFLDAKRRFPDARWIISDAGEQDQLMLARPAGRLQGESTQRA
jgi:DNA-binding NtrC family response regulator